ncbi:hypothetical protein [Synechococcus sp. MIT S9452]|uniref:hypothetical protein n=1 Tax=Synechococcus sp. MIT S9452 TaxID=3082546 RepID=UPI0039A76945
MTQLQGIHTETCEGRSCLKWEDNVELSANHQRRVIEVLCAIDPSNCPDQSSDQDT